MTEGVIISIVSGVLTLIGVCITAWATGRKTQTKVETAQAVTDEKIAELTREVREHNRVIERTFVLERDVAVIKERLNNQRGQKE